MLFEILCIHDQDTTNFRKNRCSQKKSPENHKSYSYREYNALFQKLQLFLRWKNHTTICPTAGAISTYQLMVSRYGCVLFKKAVTGRVMWNDILFIGHLNSSSKSYAIWFLVHNIILDMASERHWQFLKSNWSLSNHTGTRHLLPLYIQFDCGCWIFEYTE